MRVDYGDKSSETYAIEPLASHRSRTTLRQANNLRPTFLPAHLVCQTDPSAIA